MSCADHVAPEEGQTNTHCENTRLSLRRMSSRWWLAGLLVSCLLPAGLVQSDTARLVNRVVQVCWLVPSAIRAESRRLAHRRHWRPATGHTIAHMARGISRYRSLAYRLRQVAGIDVLSRRGPPTAYSHFV